MTNLYIRADGGAEIGFGHLTRCHALAQEARRRGLRPRFLTHAGDGSGRAKLDALGEDVSLLPDGSGSAADLMATLEAMKRRQEGQPLSEAMLVTDHNSLDTSWISGARDAGPLVMSLNDLPRITYASHIVVNGNLGAERLAYRVSRDTQLLLGPDYFFFRDAFLRPDLQRRTQPDRAEHVVVSLGAGDPANVTEQVLRSLEGITPALRVTIVVGGAYGHLESLEEAARGSSHKVGIKVDLPETAEVFATADLAISAGGSTAYEMARLGVPALLLVLSETQKDAAEALDRAGVALCLGAPDGADVAGALGALLADGERRRAMADQGMALFDGRGRERVLDAAAARMAGTHGRASA
ncbi:MAG: UDP-2,4-diacetamido-2,4,6-trideoxy-beta-L-altropyranose hydrolase [Deltaproteobacteria bacterium]|nr:UDP-2,4-diacetamido-2,4,6-trideoxy-beta-L-altropyranose hydrolase [Deltaproteobacteria bacterium]